MLEIEDKKSGALLYKEDVNDLYNNNKFKELNEKLDKILLLLNNNGINK